MTDDTKATAGGLISAITIGAALLYVSLGTTGCAGPLGAVGGPETIAAYYQGELALAKTDNHTERQRGRK